MCSREASEDFFLWNVSESEEPQGNGWSKGGWMQGVKRGGASREQFFRGMSWNHSWQ